MSENNRNLKRRDKKGAFYETEKASERMEDMHLFIQICKNMPYYVIKMREIFCHKISQKWRKIKENQHFQGV